jgi:4-diphosphocytidyl-2-C-methyl-D-erythritol kinase
VTVRVPAKINLHLAVGSRREDGYHELVTVFHAVALYDTVTATPARDLSLGISGEGAGELPDGQGNLAWRAAVLLAERAGVAPTVRLDLVKGIPVAGGLAGGSADAAATLVACDALWGVGLDRAELTELAAELGSDVAFALAGGTALGTGRGERLTPVLATGRWHWVFAISAAGLPTPQVYAELDRMRLVADPPAAGEPDRLINALRTHDPVGLGQLLANDLQAAAISLRPDLRRTLRSGLDLGALGAVVSGSGPTCAFLARSREAAVRLAASLAGAGVCRTVRVAHGPVPGARISVEPEEAERAP